MNIIKALKDKIKKADEEGIFLDTINRKNGVREPKEFKSSDIKSLKSLLDVSKITMWMKGSKEQNEMQKAYKDFYKEISKSLNSLYKHCAMIEKYNTKGLSNNIITYNRLKKDIQNQQILKHFQSSTTPANIGAISEINKITDKFNELRKSKEYSSLITAAKVDVHVKSYPEFEKMSRTKFKTNSPVIKINQYIEEQKQIKEKETKKIFLHFLREDKGDIKSAKASVFNKLNELAASVDLPRSSLEKYLSEKNDYLEINKNLYDELASALAKKLRAECEENSEFKNEAGKISEDDFKQKIRNRMDCCLGKLKFEKEEKENKEKRGFFETIYMKPVDMALSLGKSIFEGFCVWWYSGDKDKKSKKSYKLNEAIKNRVEKFCDTWLGFEMAHLALAKLITYRDQRKQNLENFLESYEKYIKDITNASKKVSIHAEEKTISTIDKEKLSKGDLKISLISPGEVVKAKDKDALSNPIVQERIALINQKGSEINKAVSKLKIEYDSAVCDVDIVRTLIKKFVGNYRKQFANALNGVDIASWAPPASCSKLTLGQAVLFSYYSLDRYEKNWHFGLDDEVLTYLLNIDKVKLGLTADEMRNIVNSVSK